jgi:putative Ca2+/H+ antiporter (TMEM165/GDT1 family)
MVALAEMGDKTQLLSFILATRFPRRPGAIILGILLATLANHFGAAYVGSWVATHVGRDAMRWVLAISFFAFAAWALKPDTLDDAGGTDRAQGAFLTTLVVFFLAEMGDKTQLATIALGARFESLTAVVLGTTAGMMAANVPAVLIGERLAQKIPLRAMRYAAAASFALFGVLVLLDVDVGLGLGG